MNSEGAANVTDRELLRLHLEAVWGLTLPALDRAGPDMVMPDGLTPWSVYLATLARDQTAIWRPDIEPGERQRLRAEAQVAGPVWDETLKMRREVVFRYPRTGSRRLAQAVRRARVLSADDAERIEAFEAGSASYFLAPEKAPCIGVVVDGQLMSIAHSSARTVAACELGINSLPEARRRGYGAAATILWTARVRELGLVPIYSAFAWNTASLHLATSIGYSPRIDGAYGPVPESGQ
jgi:RimJ/RimL family protein N-acetyltransferase